MPTRRCPAIERANELERALAARLRTHYRSLDRAEEAGDRATADARRLDASSLGLLFGRLRDVLEAHAGDHPVEGEALRELEGIGRAIDAAA
jgi:uncharacterized membrane protein YccC